MELLALGSELEDTNNKKIQRAKMVMTCRADVGRRGRLIEVIKWTEQEEGEMRWKIFATLNWMEVNN